MAWLMIFACLAAGNAAWAGGCEQAEVLFRRSRAASSPAEERALLERALALCPSHAGVLNNLGVCHENAGDLDRAEEMYRRALKVRPDFCASLAGLGDIALTRGRFAQAAKYYRRFLEALPREKARGDPLGLCAHEVEYRRKLERSRQKAGILRASLEKVVKAPVLVRGLAPAGPALRGVGGVRVRERVALGSVRFAYDSDRLLAQGREQLREVAKALKSPQLASSRILVEGHTDTFGGAAYNLDLSLRRARRVREALVGLGVAPDRLQVAGKGESQPLVPAGDKQAQAPNRRVEFVNLGPSPDRR